jgi:hypothetical protein
MLVAEGSPNVIVENIGIDDASTVEVGRTREMGVAVSYPQVEAILGAGKQWYSTRSPPPGIMYDGRDVGVMGNRVIAVDGWPLNDEAGVRRDDGMGEAVIK